VVLFDLDGVACGFDPCGSTWSWARLGRASHGFRARRSREKKRNGPPEHRHDSPKLLTRMRITAEEDARQRKVERGARIADVRGASVPYLGAKELLQSAFQLECWAIVTSLHAGGWRALPHR